MGIVVVAALVAGVVGWQIAARSATVEVGSARAGAGMSLPACLPDNGFWMLFDGDRDVVAVQTVRNPSQWPVTVISTDPEVYRFEAMADDFRDDYLFDADPAHGAPDASETFDRVVVPPRREATMWIVNPQGDVPMADGWRMFDGAPLRMRSLGVEREVFVPYHGTLYVGGPMDSDRLDKALEEACRG